MSYVDGRKYSCDRCEQETFCAHVGDGEADGGWTRWNKFEPLPDGWRSHQGIGLLCPDCSQQYMVWFYNFMGRDVWNNAAD